MVKIGRNDTHLILKPRQTRLFLRNHVTAMSPVMSSANRPENTGSVLRLSEIRLSKHELKTHDAVTKTNE